MAGLHWKIIPKYRPKHADDATALSTERCEVTAELREGGGFFSMKWRSRKRELTKRRAQIDKQLIAMRMPVGADLKPPRIGIDKKATRFFRDQIRRAPDSWPLPADEMVKEMHGLPIWELSPYPEVASLDIGWPDGGFPIPAGPEIGNELTLRLARHLSPADAVACADEIEAQVRPLVPTAPGAPPQGDPQRLQTAVVAMTWLRFWGGKGYGFQLGSTGG